VTHSNVQAEATELEEIMKQFRTLVTEILAEIIRAIRNEDVPWAAKVPRTCAQRRARL
jgi:hypothetical protein